MARGSYTSSDSFAHRAQRAEESRTRLMILGLAIVLVLNVVRRIEHGMLMSSHGVFVASEGVLLGALVFEVFMFARLRRANRAGTLLPAWTGIASVAVELGAPFALLSILHFLSPQGEVSALSAPAILLLPMVVLLSVLRLRPRLTLLTGLGAAGAHLTLIVLAIVDDAPAKSAYAMLFSYPVLLAIFGVAAALVAREVRGYVREALAEADAREVADRRVEMVEHDLEVAREIQRGLIPAEAPDIPGFEIAGVSEPADLTGGDYYDWQALPDGRVAVVLADVTGHGVGPAMVMAVCRAYARASAPLLPDLKPLLERLNDLIHADVHGTRFITFVIAVIDPVKSEVELLSAGHGPSLHYRASDARVEQFGGDGLPLGILPGEAYGVSRRIPLAPGDSILLLTDGYFEWRRASDNEQFSIRRVADVFAANARNDAKTLLRRLDEAVHAFVGAAKQDDDMTAVVIKRV